MKIQSKIILIFISCLSFPHHLLSQTGQYFFEKADSVYKYGDKQKAKELYQKAASMGNPNAHFSLAYYYVVTEDESLYHNTEAAKMGHEKALEEVLDELFFRSGNFITANPELAYKIFKIAKSKNPCVLHLSSSCQYYLYRPAVNMRKNFDGLSGLVQSEFKRDSLCGAVAGLVPFKIICKKNLGNRLAAHIFATEWLRRQN